MAFIVEMWWGRPHEILMQDVDENGELYVREVIPNGPPDPERRTFSCHADNWEVSQNIARAFGWHPKGALLHPFHRDAPPVREAGYQPDGWIRGIHEVEEGDARAWGGALKAALSALDAGTLDLPTVHSSALIRVGMTLNEFRQANRGFTPQFLASFAAFLSSGRFKFGWTHECRRGVTEYPLGGCTHRAAKRLDLRYKEDMTLRPALLVLVRHGESQRNIAKKQNRFFLDDEARRPIRGIPDHLIGLTDLGWRQARETGIALRERFGAFDQVYHSGYQRAVDTTAALLAAYASDIRDQMRVRHHLFIRERDQGHAYNMTDAEAAEAFPWLQDYWSTLGPFFAQPPGGESLAKVCERVYMFLQKLARTMAGKRVLLVTHGGTIWCCRYVLERWTYAEAERRFATEHILNCSVTHYELDGGRLVLRDAGVVYWSGEANISLGAE